MVVWEGWGVDLNAAVPITLKPHDHKKVSLKTQTLHTVEFDFTTMWDFIKKNTTEKTDKYYTKILQHHELQCLILFYFKLFNLIIQSINFKLERWGGRMREKRIQIYVCV